MRQLYGLLAEHCSRDAFLAQLARARSLIGRPNGEQDDTAESHTTGTEVLQPDGGWWRFPEADQLTTDGEDDGLELAEADQLSAPEIGDEDFTAVQQVQAGGLFAAHAARLSFTLNLANAERDHWEASVFVSFELEGPVSPPTSAGTPVSCLFPCSAGAPGLSSIVVALIGAECSFRTAE
jgi:hypothetical protein